VLARSELVGDLVAEHHIQIAERPDPVSDRDLGRAVPVGVLQRNHDHIRCAFDDAGDQIRIRRFEAILSAHEQAGPLNGDVVQGRPVGSADLEEVAEAPVGDRDDLRPFVFEQCVRGGSGAVHEQRLIDGACGSGSCDDRHGLVGSGRDLADDHGGSIDEHDIGEGPSYVDADRHGTMMVATIPIRGLHRSSISKATRGVTWRSG
jgi:hypothetical protein